MTLPAFNPDKIIDKQAFFIYCNAKNEIKKYYLVNVAVGDERFQGVSLPERRLKTFRQDRVLAVFTDLTDLEFADISTFDAVATNLPPSPSLTSSTQLQIHFTGFKKADKDRLEELAKSHQMTVTKGVTAKLSILCCGYNSSPQKKTEAFKKGALVLTEDQFIELVNTGEIPEHGEHDLVLLEEDTVENKQQDLIDTFSTMRTMPRRQTLLANFVDNYAVGWRFKVHSCHKPSLDIRLTSIVYNEETIQTWTQGHAFNFIGGELIESWPVENEPRIAFQIKFTTPAGFDTVDVVEGHFTGAFRKNNAKTEAGEFLVEQLPVLFNSQAYDEGMLTVDVYVIADTGQFTFKERITLTQVDFVTLLQFGKVTMPLNKNGKLCLGVYDPFTPIL